RWRPGTPPRERHVRPLLLPAGRLLLRPQPRRHRHTDGLLVRFHGDHPLRRRPPEEELRPTAGRPPGLVRTPRRRQSVRLAALSGPGTTALGCQLQGGGTSNAPLAAAADFDYESKRWGTAPVLPQP